MRRLIRTDGTTQDISRPLTLDEISKMIDAPSLDFVNLHHMGKPLQVMAVDDKGYESKMVEKAPGHFEMQIISANKPVNEEATRLLNCRPGTSHKIVGDVVVVFDEDFNG